MRGDRQLGVVRPFRGGELECVFHACPGVRNEEHTGRQASSLTWMTEIAKAGLVTWSIGGTGLRTCEAPRLLKSEIQDWRCRMSVGKSNLKGGAEFVELKFRSVGNTATRISIHHPSTSQPLGM